MNGEARTFHPAYQLLREKHIGQLALPVVHICIVRSLVKAQIIMFHSASAWNCEEALWDKAGVTNSSAGELQPCTSLGCLSFNTPDSTSLLITSHFFNSIRWNSEKAKLCISGALQDWSWRPLIWRDLPHIWATLDTLTTRLGAELLSFPRRRLIKRKCPRWLTASCVSYPSSVSHLGHIMTPENKFHEIQYLKLRYYSTSFVYLR